MVVFSQPSSRITADMQVLFGQPQKTEHEPAWLLNLVAVSSQGFIQLGITLASLLWVTVALLRIYHHGSGKATPHKPRGILVYEALGHVLRGATLALFLVASSRSSRQWPNAVGTAYAFLLAIFRLLSRGKSRQVILHHVNAVSLCIFLLTAAAEFLPLAVIGSTHRPEATAVAAVVMLFCSLLVAIMSPREWLMPEVGHDLPDGVKLEPANEEICSLLDAYCTYTRVDGLIRKGLKNAITMNEMDKIPWHYNPEILRRRFSGLRAKHIYTGRTLFILLWPQIILSAFIGGLMAAAELFAPLSLYRILEYINNPEEALFQPYLWLLVMFGGRLLQTVLNQAYAIVTRKLVIYIKLMLTTEVYQTALQSHELEGDFLDDGKSIKSDEAKSRSATGILENLISTDISSIMNLRIFLMALTSLPSAAMAVVGLYAIVGWPCFVGLGVMIAGTPLAGIFMAFVGINQEKLKAAQDARISLASEYLRSIKVIKYFGWEDSVVSKIGQARVDEQRYIWIINMLELGMTQVSACVPIATLLAILGLAVGVEKLPLTAATAYTTITLLNMVRQSFTFLAAMAFELPRARVSFRRFDSFFAAATPLDTYPHGPVQVKGATFRRSPKANFRLQDITIDFQYNGLNAVTGVSGSGKTTLLLALLGETVKERGEVTRQRDAAFASQSSWLQAASIRDNIVFNSPDDAEKYERIVKACCLDVDFAELPTGDETNVGENGSALSGGQRARVALARALYSPSSLLLFDDIFSALDTKTTLEVWNRVFCSEIVKSRTVILVTQLSWVLDEADVAITLDHGHVKSVDQHIGHVRRPKAAQSSVDGRSEVASSNNEPDDAAVRDMPVKNASEATEAEDLAAVDKEVASDGILGIFGFLQYISYFGGPVIVTLTILALVLGTVSDLLTNYWMARWVDQTQAEGPSHASYYLLVYVGLSFGSVLIGFADIWAFVRGSWVAAKRLHQDFIKAIFNVPISWFTTNPVGKVINRLSGDIQSLDQQIALPVYIVLVIIVNCIMMLGAVTTILPAFILPTAVLSALGIFIGIVYNRTAVILKQLVSASQSPILSNFSEGLAGMTVIRATSSMPRRFIDRMNELLYASAQANASEIEADQWLKFRINTLASAINVSAAILALIQMGSLSAGIVGFGLSQATQMSEMVLYLVFNISDVNIQMQTFHRIRQYCRLPPEEDTSTDKSKANGTYSDDVERTISHDWPQRGSVEFRNVTVRYDLDGPDILKDINVKFNAGERVAVVGRTGSGKSTLILSILRFTHIVSGQVLFDGVDITAIPRRRLRQAVSTIPQEAQLFQGTLAANLDPTGCIPESQLQKALVVCQSIAAMKRADPFAVADDNEAAASTSTSVPGANFAERLALSTNVKAKGDNFSHGQRQVLSLCRILVRKSKLMLLDEATSSMDTETDAGVQQALRNEFSESDGQNRCLVTVAHRLQTIADYDKVVVMGAGEVLEVGSPQELMRTKGAFFDMVMHDREGSPLKEGGA